MLERDIAFFDVENVKVRVVRKNRAWVEIRCSYDFCISFSICNEVRYLYLVQEFKGTQVAAWLSMEWWGREDCV